jgi:hypothetical protein
MPDIGRTGDPGGEAPDRDQPAVFGDVVEEGARGEDLREGRAPVRGLRARMGGNDVPAERVELELRENALNHGGRRLARPDAGELALGGERKARDAGAPIAGSFTNEKQ